MAKTRGAHSFQPQVRQGPTPPVSSAAGDSFTAATSVGPSVPATRPSAATIASPAPAAVQGTAAADAEGSSSVASA